MESILEWPLKNPDSISVVVDVVTLLVLSLGVFFYDRKFEKREQKIKKHELTTSYRNDVLSWYSRTINNMVLLRHLVQSNDVDKNEIIRLLSELSALAEIGRFFFHNVDNEKFGQNKPTANKGYRCIHIEFLLWFYWLVQEKTSKTMWAIL